MAFNSFQFWLIFPFIFGIYWLIPIKYNTVRKVFLILVSYLLYMNWKPAFAIVLLGVTLVTYSGGRLLGSQEDIKKRKRIVWLFASFSLLPLLVFKYYNFLNDSILQLLSAIGLKFSLPGLNWAIPVGISFFTFQAVGYLLDVYHKRVSAEKNIIDYMLFVSFFPQVTSGPISKADEFLPQIKSPHKFDYGQGKQGLKYLLWGMFIKLVIADRLGLFVDTVYANYIHYNGTTCFVASIFYTLQIYCDFAGYSFMAIGIARTLGFSLVNNFNRPYMAVSVTDFWKRWHISLTRWLTWQIYVPLGGNRCTKARCYLNILITFLVSGIWHGANWTFVLWGLLHGVLQVMEKILGIDPKGKYYKTLETLKPLKPLRICVTFLLVSFAWIFFRMPNIEDVFSIIGKIFTDMGVPQLSDMGGAALLMLSCGLLILCFKDLRDEFFCKRFMFLENRLTQWAIYLLLFCMIINFGVLDGGQFIYVDF